MVVDKKTMRLCPICKKKESYVTFDLQLRCLSCNRNARRLNVKPVSVNEAYTGRRFSTPKLKRYKDDLFKILPKMKVEKGKLSVKYTFGLSSKGSDVDNCIKALQDILAEAYGFNDNQIYKMEVEKVDVLKGGEFIEFDIAVDK